MSAIAGEHIETAPNSALTKAAAQVAHVCGARRAHSARRGALRL